MSLRLKQYFVRDLKTILLHGFLEFLEKGVAVEENVGGIESNVIF